MKVFNSLRARLIIPVIGMSLTLLIATIVFLGQRQLKDVRQNAISQAHANLQLIADYASVPLIFDQPEDALEVLSGARNMQSVLSAAIYGADNKLFVSYGPGSAALQFDPQTFGKSVRLGKKSMLIAVPIMHRDERYGTMVAEIDLQVQQQLIRQLFWLFLTVFGAMAILAIITTFLFERKFLKPILLLTEKFREVSAKNNRNESHELLRLDNPSTEFGILIDGYNKMVSALAVRERKQAEAEHALKEMNEKLESKVAERTTELESAHEKLQKLYRNEKVLLENLPYGIILIDYNLHLVEMNNFARALLCPSQELALSNCSLSRFCREDMNHLPTAGHHVFRDTEESVFVGDKGKEIPVLRTIVPVTYNDQNVIMLAFVNITALKKAQKELVRAKEKAEEADKLKSAFLANMSHEIRTPLNAIVGFTSMLISEEFDPQTKDTYMQIVEENTENLLKLIEDILDLSKLESGTLDIIPREVDLSSFVRDIHHTSLMTRDRMQKPAVEIKLEFEPELEGTKGFFDNFRVRQVLLNLINNALKFTEKGSVELQISHNSHELQFTVRDTGSGIEDKDRDYIFDRFYKSGDTKKIYKGTGLGLAISKSLVELSGGKIWLEPSTGKGTTFCFTIPLSPPSPEM